MTDRLTADDVAHAHRALRDSIAGKTTQALATVVNHNGRTMQAAPTVPTVDGQLAADDVAHAHRSLVDSARDKTRQLLTAPRNADGSTSIADVDVEDQAANVEPVAGVVVDTGPRMPAPNPALGSSASGGDAMQRPAMSPAESIRDASRQALGNAPTTIYHQ